MRNRPEVRRYSGHKLFVLGVGEVRNDCRVGDSASWQLGSERIGGLPILGVHAMNVWLTVSDTTHRCLGSPSPLKTLRFSEQMERIEQIAMVGS